MGDGIFSDAMRPQPRTVRSAMSRCKDLWRLFALVETVLGLLRYLVTLKASRNISLEGLKRGYVGGPLPPLGLGYVEPLKRPARIADNGHLCSVKKNKLFRYSHPYKIMVFT